MKLSGWGRYPVCETEVQFPRTQDAVSAALQDGPAIARGNGRSYGDTALGAPNTLDMRHFNRMISFDDATGTLTAEAGVLLADVISSFLPRGWFPAVTPGTKFVTLGGMIAADVHGKNHHRDGSFRQFVDWIDLMDETGEVLRCSRTQNAELFDWTLGGMGLTGIILRTAIRLRRVETGWISQTTLPAPNLDAAIDLIESNLDALYSVAWIDCLATGSDTGRSLVMLGEHALLAELGKDQSAHPFGTEAKRSLSVPIDFPAFSLNRYSIRAFNSLYYWNGGRKSGESLVHWNGYFYPLDAILAWNRIYGRRGFCQFQCALPLETSAKGLKALLTETSNAGLGSFLAVLKRFGEQSGQFSFPMPGYTLALDFPMGRYTEDLLKRLDDITIDNGGRFYLAKDARMSAATFARSDDRVRNFKHMRRDTGLDHRFQSHQSKRLEL